MLATNHLQTLFKLNARDRIVSTREPNPSLGPGFVLIRRSDSCAWAVGAGVSDETARKLSELAIDENPITDFQQPPKYAREYEALVKGVVESGPAFEFPCHLDRLAKVVLVRDINLLRRSFEGWTEEELPERSPIVAVFEDNRPASICFCARVSELAAEAGVETAPDFRGHGLAGMATSAWAAEIRDSGRTPVYSTSWNNKPSLVVARKLGLVACASYWSIEARD